MPQREFANGKQKRRSNSPVITPSRSDLYFRISSGLKRIIGRDLIVNEFVAIFELVKNSFDAGAGRVELIFANDRLYIVDDGKGMSRSDVDNKWLFVAYSAKQDGSEDADQNEDYRDRIRTPKVYAGNKGVGRFSCDRLGRGLRLQSRTSQTGALVEIVEVDWDSFEQDPKKEFARIPVRHSVAPHLELPKGFTPPPHGTILEISHLRQMWNRQKLLDLKAALAKLINPFGAATDLFEVRISAPSELEADIAKSGLRPLDGKTLPEESYHQVVNGVVQNFIFETLRNKTTHLDVEVNDDDNTILSSLIDRGELIYQISEPNAYPLLRGSGFRCQLYYLNQSAKLTFARRMGVPSVKFGSIFLFRNGFRVFPIGEEGDDSFGIDRRKQQGYSRFLGTRDLIGRIDVTGTEEYFKEATSRDQGLIRTAAYEQLETCFREKCLKRLERYVVDISWKDPADKDYDDISRLRGDKASARITDLVARLADADGIKLLAYSPNLVRILNAKSEDFESSLKALRLLAERTQNRALLRKIDEAEERYRQSKRAEEEARAQAEQERRARAEAEKRAAEAEAAQQQAEAAQQQAESAYKEERKRNLFLASVTSVDHDTIVNLHHQIVIYAADIQNNIANQIDKIRHGEPISTEALLAVLENISFKNQKILAVSRFATKANFRLDSEEIEEDLAEYVAEYIERVCPLYSGDGIVLNLTVDTKGLHRRFKPIEVSILLDNLISNAKKAGASEIDIVLEQPNAKEIILTITDDGAGLDKSIIEPDRVFEKGFSTTSGSGLGLYYVQYILDQMKGAIAVDQTHRPGARFIVRIFK